MRAWLQSGIIKVVLKHCLIIFSQSHALYQCHDSTPDNHNWRRFIALLGIIAFSWSQRLSSYFPHFMSLLLSSSGAQRQVSNTTNALGITESDNATDEMISGLESNG